LELKQGHLPEWIYKRNHDTRGPGFEVEDKGGRSFMQQGRGIEEEASEIEECGLGFRV
jgi:hypothetical protein